MTTARYKRWLEEKLKKNKISDRYLIALIVVTERIVQRERTKLIGRVSVKPYYNLFSDNGTGERKRTRAWFYAAELALWLNYTGYPAELYLTAILSMPRIRRLLRAKHQIHLNTIQPSTRNSRNRIREYQEYFIKYCKERGINLDA